MVIQTQGEYKKSLIISIIMRFNSLSISVHELELSDGINATI